jgi:hypothetical protein
MNLAVSFRARKGVKAFVYVASATVEKTIDSIVADATRKIVRYDVVRTLKDTAKFKPPRRGDLAT